VVSVLYHDIAGGNDLMKVKCNSKTGNYLGEYKNLYTLYRQALVKPKLKYIQQFDVTGNAKIQSFKVRGGIAYQKQIGASNEFLHHTLEALFNTAHPEFTNYYKVFFLRMFVPELLASHY